MKIIEMTVHQYYARYKNTQCITIGYGAGAYASEFLKVLNSGGIEIAYFCDRDPLKSGKYLAGKKIVLPRDIPNSDKAINFILTLYCEKKDFEKLALEIEEEFFLNTCNIEIFCVKSNGIYFDSISQYQYTPHWFYPLCYDRVIDYSSSYPIQLFESEPIAVVKNNKLILQDIQSKYINEKNGQRYTAGVNFEAENKIWFLGDSRIFGWGCEDQYTIESFLQYMIKSKSDLNFDIYNYGGYLYTIFSYYQKLIELDIQSGDIVIFGCQKVFLTPISFTSMSEEAACHLYVHYLTKMRDFCVDNDVRFYYLYLPRVDEIENPSLVEQYHLMTFVSQSPTEAEESVYKNFTVFNLSLESLLSLASLEKIECINLQSAFLRPHQYGEVFIDRCHLSPNGNFLVADFLYKFLCQEENHRKASKIYKSLPEKYERTLEEDLLKNYNGEILNNYLVYLKKHQIIGKKSGAIVMNCNPFTLGHRYLIEKALQQVEVLYVFILQTDDSYFSYEERVDLLKKGVSDLNRVIVLRSDEFIISMRTMPEYFRKDKLQNEVVDCTEDLLVFSHFIAPTLNIQKRFVGTEPFCAVTKQYNHQMKRILTSHNIQVIEIQRLERNGDCISASSVRKCIENKQFELIKQMVPVTTYDHIINHYYEKKTH